MSDIFEDKLTDQLSLLADSSRLFDEGRYRQSKAISSRLYTICHDLIRQPGWPLWCKSKDIQFYSTGRVPEGVHNEHPLVGLSMDAGGSFVPIGDEVVQGISLLRFSKWWEESILRNSGKVLSRKNLTFQMRNYDGGSHALAEEPDNPAYREIAAEPGLGWKFVAGNPQSFHISEMKEIVGLSVLDATVRQISHEVLRTFLPHMPNKSQIEIEYPEKWNPFSSLKSEMVLLGLTYTERP